MAKNQHKYFYEDEVWKLHKGSLRLGMVVETSEFTSSDESSDDEDQVKPGDVRVAWYPTGNEEVIPEKKLHLADRSLMPGDVVRRMTDKGTAQRGFCRNVHVFSCVEILGTKQVVFGVKSEDLLPLEQFKSEILICKDGWVGFVRTVKAILTLRFPDGSKVSIDDNLAGELEDINNRKEHDTEFIRYDYYPGQVLFGPVRILDCGDWKECSPELTTARKNKPHKAYKMTVEDVDFQRLTVNWLCRANFGSTELLQEKVEQPPAQVAGSELAKVRMLNVFGPSALQIGDRNFYHLKEDTDLIMSKSEWKKLHMDQLVKRATAPPPASASGKPKLIKSELNQENDAAESSDNNDDCDDEKDTDSTSSDKRSIEGGGGKKQRKKKSQPALSTRVAKKKKLKASKAQREQAAPPLLIHNGMKVVTEALSTRSEVDVVWQDGGVESNVPSTDLYPIQHLDEHEFFPGDFVVESKEGFHPHTYGVIQNVDYAGRFCRVKWFRTYTEGNQPEPVFIEANESSVYDLKDHPDFKFRPGALVVRVANWAGNSCGLGAGQVMDTNIEGLVKVWWCAEDKEGIQSECWPQDLYKVGEYDDDEGLWADDEDEDSDDSDGSWDTESEHEVEEDDTELHDEAAELKKKLISNVEKARITMIKLEEILAANPTLETTSLIKQLVGVISHCKYLDRLMSTTFFDESHFNGLIEKIKGQHKNLIVEVAVRSQFSRLFSSSSTGDGAGSSTSPTKKPAATEGVDNTSPSKEPTTGSPEEESPGKDSGNGSLLNDSSVGGDDDQVCGPLCKLLKVQLVKAHEEVVKRYGEQELINYAEQDADWAELNQTIASELEILGFIPFDTPIFTEGGGVAASVSDPVITSPDIEKPDIPLESIVALSPGSFQANQVLPENHKFKLTVFQPANTKTFIKAVRREIVLLQSSLPAGITVKGFDERMDLFSAMIEGPKNTPYEDGLFFFDFQLGAMYPSVPPTCHYISYCTDRLNPNLYEDGKVCVSLLGTWNGKGTETWTPNSNLLQLLVSIQGLILVREPYYNEAGYEKQRGSQEGAENSRTYNEMALLKMVQSMTRLLQNPPSLFQPEIKAYCGKRAPALIERLEKWMSVSLTLPSTAAALPDKFPLPDFPLLPASKGFCLSLQKSIGAYKTALQAADILP